MESGLTFNQLICEFESRHPCHKTFHVGCSSKREQRCAVNAEGVGFESHQPTQFTGAVAQGKSARLSTGKPRVQISPAPPILARQMKPGGFVSRRKLNG
jgi:hypothetical protein